MFRDSEKTILDNAEYFDFGNGLWTGKNPPLKKINVIRNTNFTAFGQIDFSNIAQIEVEIKKFEKRKLIKGDIIIERSGGGPKQPVGRVVYFDVDAGDYSFSNFTSRIRVVRTDVFNHKFIFYYLLSFYLAGNTESLQARTTGIRNLDFNKYKERVSIPILGIPEQQNVTYILSLIQSAIETQEKIIQATTELKKALMQKLFTDGLKGEPQKETEIGLMPESWEVSEFKNIATLQGGYAFKSKDVVKDSNVQLIRMGNLYQNKLDLGRAPRFYPDSFPQKYPKFVLRPGDLIISLTGTMGKEDYGFTIKIPCDTKKQLLLNQRVARIVFNSKMIDKDYFLYFLLSRKFLDRLYKTAKGTKQANLSTNTIAKFPIIIPPKEEQEQIAVLFLHLETKIDFHLKRKRSLEALFKSMLHHLMTGQIRVKNLQLV